MELLLNLTNVLCAVCDGLRIAKEENPIVYQVVIAMNGKLHRNSW